jgi:putative tryptophan/tyrosine transport system substrate-binding protein
MTRAGRCSASGHMRRRDVLTLFGAAAAWPLEAEAQQGDRMRLIGVLMSTAADDPLGQARHSAFSQGLQQAGWVDGSNVHIETRWSAGDGDRIRRYAAELVSLAPDVILASGGTVVGPLLQTTRRVPVVFTQTPDPVAAGFVASLARPSGNATGFTQFEYGTSAKWLELLKEIAPAVTRAAVLRDPSIPEGVGQFAVIQAAASSFRLELRAVDVREVNEMQRTVAEFARNTRASLIVTNSATAIFRRELIIRFAAEHGLPAVYPARYFVSAGGLISYGPDTVEPHRQAAGYVDRILRGDAPGDLPVQAPAKHELALNRKTAKALGLDVPPTLLARADEVIE